jgi:protein-S-isoprenylcysteine O-methyltransferase Ste14
MVVASRGGECDVVGGGDEHVSFALRPYPGRPWPHRVTSGPYGYVRHPMYAGVIVLFLCIPLVLGSWLALLPGAANAVLMVIRARQEDRMLRAELGGYEVYAHRVRYRLLPGVW